MSQQLSHEDLMRFLDGEVSPEERHTIEAVVQGSSELQRELAIYHSMKEGLRDLSFAPHGGGSVWDRIRGKISKPIGWTLTLAGSVAWLAYGAWVFIQSPPAIAAKLATGGIAIGILVLLADVIWERYREYGSDPYRDIQR